MKSDRLKSVICYVSPYIKFILLIVVTYKEKFQHPNTGIYEKSIKIYKKIKKMLFLPLYCKTF